MATNCLIQFVHLPSQSPHNEYRVLKIPIITANHFVVRLCSLSVIIVPLSGASRLHLSVP